MLVRTLVFVVVSCTALSVHAQVYKIKKDDGTVVFTDTPEKSDSQTFEFDSKTNNIAVKIPGAKPGSSTSAVKKQKQIRYTLNILSPEPEATIRSNQGNVTIMVAASPQPTGRFQLILDGAPVQQNTSGAFALSEVNRGTHTFKIKLLDNKGKTLATSKQQTFFMHQATALINNKNQ